MISLTVKIATETENARRTNLTGTVNDRYVHDVGVRVLDPCPVLPGRLVCPLDRASSLVGPVDEVAKLRQPVRTYQTGNDLVSIAAGHKIDRLYVVLVQIGPVQPTGIEVDHQSTDSANVVQICYPVFTVQCRSFHTRPLHPVTPVEIATPTHNVSYIYHQYRQLISTIGDIYLTRKIRKNGKF